jgi:hypothetical protein
MQGQTITLNTNTITNAGTVAAGAHNLGGFFVDSTGDGTAEYTVSIPRQTNSTAAGGTYTRSVVWTVPANAPPGTNYRIGYSVDSSSEVTETNEGNNWSGWSAPFTVTAAPLPCFANPNLNNCNLTPLTSHGGTAGACRANYSGACSYTCNNGNWVLNTNSCVPTPPTIEATKRIVTSGETITVNWTTGGYDPAQCTLSGTGLTAAVGALSQNVTITSRTVFRISCASGTDEAEATVEIRPSLFET